MISYNFRLPTKELVLVAILEVLKVEILDPPTKRMSLS